MDFSKVEYISFSCLRLQMRLAQEMKKRGGKVQMINGNQTVLNKGGAKV